MEVQMTNGIPICPKCQKPTERSGGGCTSTLVAYPARFGKEGNNINPDRNALTLSYCCHECGTDYKIRGNEVDGFKYLYDSQPVKSGANTYIFAGEKEEENTPHQTIKINRWPETNSYQVHFEDGVYKHYKNGKLICGTSSSVNMEKIQELIFPKDVDDYEEFPTLTCKSNNGVTSDWSEIERIIKSKDNKLTHLSVVFDWRSFSFKWKYESEHPTTQIVILRNKSGIHVH